MGPDNAGAQKKATMTIDQRAPIMRSYTYKGLARDRDEIRLLKLLPDNPSSPASKLLSLESGQHSILRCQLITVDLDQAPPYVALSYTWATEDGDAGLTRRMIVHSEVETENDGLMYPTETDEVIYVTANCEDALRRTRDSSFTEFLWVDAICIDQNRILERNYQVSTMDRIYTKATGVKFVSIVMQTSCQSWISLIRKTSCLKRPSIASTFGQGCRNSTNSSSSDISAEYG